MNFNPNKWPTVDNDDNAEEPLVKELGISDESINNDPTKKQRVEEIKKFLKENPKQDKTYDTPISRGFMNQLRISKENPEEIKEYQILREKLRGKIVVDLGCGEMGYVLDQMKNLGVKGYIGVDILLPAEKKLEELKETNKGPEISYVKDYMLLFLAKLPDKSVNLVINGIDDIIITSEEYWKKIKEQIQRVVEERGVVTGVELSKSMGNIVGFIDISPQDEEMFKIKILEKNTKEFENQISKKRELTKPEISKKAKELGVPETYLEYAQLIKKMNGSSEIKLSLNNFWYKISKNQIDELKETYKDYKENLEEKIKEYEEEVKNGPDHSGGKYPDILREELKNYEVAIEKWGEFENENKDLFTKIIELNEEKQNLVNTAYSLNNEGRIDEATKAFDKVIKFNNENDKFYEQAYLILAKKGVARNILRG